MNTSKKLYKPKGKGYNSLLGYAVNEPKTSTSKVDYHYAFMGVKLSNIAQNDK